MLLSIFFSTVHGFIVLPDSLLTKSINFSLWESKKVDVTKVDKSGNPVTSTKTVFSLYPWTLNIADVVDKLKKMINNLKWHIFTAHKQWNAHDVRRASLDLNSLITVEDYQMNVEVVYTENPTSLAYSTNKKSVALYPICVEYLNDEGLLAKGAIAFLSNDKKHEHQQVEEFELRAFKIIKGKINREIYHWKRFSDGCTGQFRSRFTAASLFKMKEKLDLEF